jgi:nitrogen fixation protein NifU and related proteins
MFSATVLDHFYNPRNVGPLEGATHEGTAGVPGDGPYLRLWFRFEGDTVRAAAYRTYGCPAAVASGSVLAELAPGRTLAQLRQITPADVMRLLGGLPEGKGHCAELVAEALRRTRPVSAGVAPGDGPDLAPIAGGDEP